MHSTSRSVGYRAGMRRFGWIVPAMALLLMFPSRMAFAQYDLGDLVGTIRDSSGAAVPNVTVTVTNDATGIATVVKTNESGDYEVPELRVGVYTISASAAGFAIAEAKSITVSVGARVRIDLVLKVGTAQATTVEVSDVALQLQTESSQRDQTITNYQTQSLPLVSRNYSDLVDYVVGAHGAPADATVTSVTSFTRAGSFNVNGQRSMFNDYMIDGMDNNSYNESNQGFDNQIIQPPPDSVANFEVITNNESAEYGRSSGATVNVATKSGTNQFHTTLYEFIRNTDLNAFGYIKPLTYNAAGNPYPFFKPLFNRNQFGANFGGPIIKNRFFWFLDYEGFRQTLTPTVVDTVPTLDELSGVLAVAVQDPWSPTTAIPAGSYIPALASVTGISTSGLTAWPTQALSDLDTTAETIAKLYMQALPTKCQETTAGTSSGVATNNCPLNAPFTDHADKGDLRLDFQQNANTSWFLKVSDRKEVGKNYNLLPEPIDMQTNGHILIHDEQVAAGYNHAFSANKFLDARLALSETKAGKWTFAVGSTSFPSGTIPGLPTIANVSGGLPSMAISGGFSSFGRQSTNPQWQNPSLVDPKVNFSWVKGHHSLKFGYEWEKVWQEIQDSNPLYGSFTYGGGYSACTSASGCSGTSKVGDTYWADFLFGTSSAYSLATYYIAHVYQSMDSAYAQDDWKVNSKMTLNLGLRWEYGSPWWERNNYISNFNPATGGMLTLTPGYTATTVGGYNNNGMCGSVACIAPYSGSGVFGKSLVNPNFRDWAPRFGFAAAVTPSIVLRGGYGTAFIHYWRAGSGNNIAINAPFALYTVVSNPSTVGTTNGFVRLSQGFPSNTSGGNLANTFSPGTDDIDSIPPSTKDGYAESWFVDVQKSVGKNTKVDLAYVGNHGVHLQGFINANQRNPALPLTTAGQFPGIAANQFQRPYMSWGGYLLNNSSLYPTFSNGDITQALSEFHSSYHALQARYEQRATGGLTLLNSFTWSHALDNASSTLEANTPCPQNGFNIEADYGQSDYNLPITNVTTLVYELPFGQGRRFLNNANPVVNAILGGWQISGVNTMDAGTPFNLTYNPASANALSPELTQNWRGENLYRPNLVTGVPYLERVPALTGFTSGAPSGKPNGYVQYINPAAIAFPETYTTGSALTTGGTISSPLGNLPKNYGRTPAFYETDLDFNKKFNTPIERVKIEFRSELYNILNHTNLYLPGGSGGGTASGTDNGLANTVSALGGGQITGTWEPRIVQFGLKITY